MVSQAVTPLASCCALFRLIPGLLLGLLLQLTPGVQAQVEAPATPVPAAPAAPGAPAAAPELDTGLAAPPSGGPSVPPPSADTAAASSPAGGASPSTAPAAAAPTAALRLPQFTARLSTEQVRAGQPVQLQLVVRWEGAQDDWTLYPPTLTLASGVIQGAVQQNFEASGGVTSYFYQYMLTPEAASSLELGTAALQLRANPALIGAPTEPQTLNLDLPTLEVTPGGTASIVSQLLAGLILIGVVVGGLFLMRRKPRATTATPAAPPPEKLETLVSQARRALIEGREADAYALLRRIKPLLPTEKDPLPADERLLDAELKARYGGQTERSQGLERLVESLEKLV